MTDLILKYFTSEDDHDPETIVLVRNIILFTLVATIALIFIETGLATGRAPYILVIIILSVSMVFDIIALAYVFRGNIIPAKIILPITLNVAVTYILIDANGLHDVSVIGIPLVLIISMLLQGGQASRFSGTLAVLSITSVAIADILKITQSDLAARTGIDDTILGVVFMVSCAYLLGLMITRLNHNILNARKSEHLAQEANKSLQELRANLEHRITERTQELEKTSAQIHKRATQFEAISDVSNSIASLKDINELLPEIAEIISDRFGFYHVGIFLLDETREYAILRASNSDGGRRMLARKYKLKVDASSLVGYAATRIESRIALDTGPDAVFFDNPDLPSTHSEVAMPMRIGSKVIGVLDVQSETPSAFSDDDLAVLSTLANQVAIAIQNTALYNETRQALAEAEKTYQKFIVSGWQRIASDSALLGYQSAGAQVSPLDKPLDSTEVKTAQQRGEAIITSDKKSEPNVAIPIKLRGQVIGVLNVHSREKGRRWDEQELVLVRSLAERVALALENARLLQESQRRASKERLIGDIANKINSANTYQNIISIAVRELGMAISSDEVTIQFQEDQDR